MELLLAGLIASLVLGVVSLSLTQLSKARNGSKQQLEAYLRADAALNALRGDIMSVLRDPDLFWTRLVVTDHGVSTPLGTVDRDEILLFNSTMRPVRDLDFIGEGREFETQYRVMEDALGTVLWQRRDGVPDEYPRGGGTATPLVPGIIALGLEVYDGEVWLPDWDSDFDGLPLAVRVTVLASGHRDGQDPFDAPVAMLRTTVPIDRVTPPAQPPPPEEPQETPDDEPAEPDAETGGTGTGAPPAGMGGGTVAPPAGVTIPGGIVPGAGGNTGTTGGRRTPDRGGT